MCSVGSDPIMWLSQIDLLSSEQTRLPTVRLQSSNVWVPLKRTASRGLARAPRSVPLSKVPW